jgi:hypothetical protein
MRRSRVVALSVLLAVLGSVSLATSAQAACSSGTFCGYDAASYVTKMYQISGGSGTTISLADADKDKTTSAHNKTTKYYCGVNEQLFADHTLYEFHPGEDVPSLNSTANNAIDHYDVKNNTGNCVNPI